LKDNGDIRQNLDTELRKTLGLVKTDAAAPPAESPVPVAVGKAAPPRK
jgi:hypothetical protein